MAGSIPTTTVNPVDFADGMDILTLLKTTGLIASTSEGRRLVEQGRLTSSIGRKVKSAKHFSTSASLTLRQY